MTRRYRMTIHAWRGSTVDRGKLSKAGGMLAFDVDVASAGAGLSRAKALYRKITVASVPLPGSLARLTFQPKRSHSRRTIDRPSPVPCGRLGSAR